MPHTVGIVADLHLPWAHPMYLKFCVDTFQQYGVDTVVFIGDVTDQHAFSRFDHDPDGLSPGAEIDAVLEMIAPWKAAFPKATVVIGNHDERIYRKALRDGYPKKVMQPLEKVFETPGWKWVPEKVIDGVLYIHGTGASGKDAAINLALQRRMPTVIGHTHTYAGVKYHANANSLIFGMNVGCGIDLQKYAFIYAKAFPTRPVLGCGIVKDGVATFVPMPCSPGQRYHRSKAVA